MPIVSSVWFPVRNVGKHTKIYFIQRGKGGPVKVGRADDPAKRMRTLQTACPERLELLYSFVAPAGVEGEIHHQLATHNISGEWFKPHAEVFALISLLAKKISSGDGMELGGYRIMPAA